MKIQKSIEHKISKKDENLFDKFIEFLKKEYPLENDIKIRFMSNRMDEMTTGGRTNKHTLKILSKGRMNRDILRTIAHEWMHEYQRTVLKRKKQSNIGSKNENEANAEAGVLLKKFEEKYPKLVDSLYENIIKKVIRESLEEESDKDDWGWISDVNPFNTGHAFDDDDICFNSDSSCKVNINNDNIKFVLDYEWWLDFSNIDDDDRMYLEPFFNNPNYDGGGDFYDFDYEEFDYSGNYIRNEQRERFQKILDIVAPGENISYFIDNDQMYNISEKLKYKPLQKLYDDLINGYLEVIGYRIQENRWLSTGNWFKEISKNINTIFKMNRYGDEIIITVAMSEVFKLHDKNINSLTDILQNISYNLSNESWVDGFYEEWDISGAEDDINNVFNDFLDKAEELLDDEEDIKPYKDFIDLIESLGFKQNSRHVYGSGNTYMSPNPNHNTKWYITDVNYETETLSLKLYPWNANFWTDPIKLYKISFEDLPKYVNNYSLSF